MVNQDKLNSRPFIVSGNYLNFLCIKITCTCTQDIPDTKYTKQTTTADKLSYSYENYKLLENISK